MRSAVHAAPHAFGRPHPAPGRVVRGPARLARGVAGALAMTVLAALFHAAAVPGAGTFCLASRSWSVLVKQEPLLRRFDIAGA